VHIRLNEVIYGAQRPHARPIGLYTPDATYPPLRSENIWAELGAFVEAVIDRLEETLSPDHLKINRLR